MTESAASTSGFPVIVHTQATHIGQRVENDGQSSIEPHAVAQSGRGVSRLMNVIRQHPWKRLDRTGDTLDYPITQTTRDERALLYWIASAPRVPCSFTKTISTHGAPGSPCAWNCCASTASTLHMCPAAQRSSLSTSPFHRSLQSSICAICPWQSRNDFCLRPSPIMRTNSRLMLPASFPRCAPRSEPRKGTCRGCLATSRERAGCRGARSR
jgi:hypothetical protein